MCGSCFFLCPICTRVSTLAQAVTLLTCIWNIRGSSIGWVTVLGSWFSPVPQVKCQYSSSTEPQLFLFHMHLSAYSLINKYQLIINDINRGTTSGVSTAVRQYEDVYSDIPWYLEDAKPCILCVCFTKTNISFMKHYLCKGCPILSMCIGPFGCAIAQAVSHQFLPRSVFCGILGKQNVTEKGFEYFSFHCQII